MTSTKARVQAGIPTGGQFAATDHAEGGVSLTDDAPTRDWGLVSGVTEGSRTPWGAADSVHHGPAGIVQVGTPGHGGIKLSPERNAVIPGPLRNSSGWYEEDEEVNIVGLYHPDAFPRVAGGDTTAAHEQFKASVMDYHPTEYEKATGEQIPFGVSHSKDEAGYYADKTGTTLVYSTGAREDPEFPGYVNVSTRVHGSSGFTQHLIPVDAYNTLERSHGAAHNIQPVLPAGSIDVTPPPPAPKAAETRHRTVDTTKLTPTQQARVEADLSKQWRDTDGRVVTLQQLIDEGAVVGKTKAVSGNSDRQGHYLRMSRLPEGESGDSGNRVWPVSAATYKAMQAPAREDEPEPDRDAWRAVAAEKDRVARETARAAYDKAMAEKAAQTR